MSKKTVLLIILAAIFGMASVLGIVVISGAEKEVLPEIIQVKNHKDGKRTPLVFKEDFSDTASTGEIKYDGEKAFTFSYSKSSKKAKPFTGALFPLENLKIDFSKNTITSVLHDKFSYLR